MRLYLDASAIVYGVEGSDTLSDWVQARLDAVEEAAGVLLTSRMCPVEALVKPLREQDEETIFRYAMALTRPALKVFPVSNFVLEEALRLRVIYNFKTADAIHLATAIVHEADAFLTGDRQLRRCRDIEIELIQPPSASTG